MFPLRIGVRDVQLINATSRITGAASPPRSNVYGHGNYARYA